MSEARVIEDDVKLAIRVPGQLAHKHLSVRPSAGNGATIECGIVTIRLTVEERKRVAKALWPDAFKEEKP
jgi:hypothetical protein